MSYTKRNKRTPSKAATAIADSLSKRAEVQEGSSPSQDNAPAATPAAPPSGSPIIWDSQTDSTGANPAQPVQPAPADTRPPLYSQGPELEPAIVTAEKSAMPQLQVQVQPNTPEGGLAQSTQARPAMTPLPTGPTIDDSRGMPQAPKGGLAQSAQARYNAQIANGKRSLAEILLADRDAQIRAAEEEDARMRELERKRSLWTGAGELAAGIANLVGVAHGASNQTYNSYSLDWQRKADQDARERRARIDNLKARRAEIGEQMARLDEQRRQQDRAAKEQREWQEREAKKKRDWQDAKDAKQREWQEQEAKKKREWQEGEAEKNRNAKAAEAAAQRKVTLATHGLKADKDGSIVPDPKAMAAKAAVASARKAKSGSGGQKNVFHYTDDDGNLHPVKMTGKEYDEFIHQAYAYMSALPDDDGKMRKINEFAKTYSSIRQEKSEGEASGYVWQMAQTHPELVRLLEKYASPDDGNAAAATDDFTSNYNAAASESTSAYDKYK